MFSRNQVFHPMETPKYLTVLGTSLASIGNLFTAGRWSSFESGKVYKNAEPTIPVTDTSLKFIFFAPKCRAHVLTLFLSLNFPETLLLSETAFVSEPPVRLSYPKVSHIFMSAGKMASLAATSVLHATGAVKLNRIQLRYLEVRFLGFVKLLLLNVSWMLMPVVPMLMRYNVL